MGSAHGEPSSLLDKLRHFFDNDDWKYQVMDDRPILSGGFKGENGSWRFIAQAKEERGQIFIYSILDINVPENKRMQVAEYLTRANYGLSIGNFELDFNDGEVRYKTSMDLSDNEELVNDALIKNLVYVNLVTTDQYFPGLMAVIYGGKSPVEAINEIENNESEEE